MNRKGQAAVEYLVTYGWVFVVILAAIAALSYFDLLSPSQYLPGRCDFGQQLSCVDQYLDTDEKVVIRFKNLFGANITVVDAWAFNPATEAMDNSIFVGDIPVPGPVTIAQNEIGRVELNLAGFDAWTEGRKERVSVIITLQRQGGTVRHNVTGTILAEVSEPLQIN